MTVKEAEETQVYIKLMTNVASLRVIKCPTSQETRLYVAQLTTILKALENRNNATSGQSNILNESPTTVYNTVKQPVSDYADIAN